MKNCVVYRYVDLRDNKTKYIGIVTAKSKKRCLEDRLKEHNTHDEWAKGNFRIEYFVVETRTDAEAFEAHLIAYYKTYEYFNKAKKDWGLSHYLPTKINWIHYITYQGSFKQDTNRRSMTFEKEAEISKHKYKIWFGVDNRWHTYVLNPNTKKGVSEVRKKNKNDLIAFLNIYYETK